MKLHRSRVACRLSVALACVGAALAASAQPSAPRAASAAAPADADLGARIAALGAGGAAACASCHGASGEGNAAANFPRIAGQSIGYLQRQLDAYANGARTNPVMMPIAKALDDAQRRAVAAHYAALPAGTGNATAGNATKPTATPKATATTAASNASSARGRQLASVGDENERVQACANCHGPGGIGQAPDYPYLAGQLAGYLQAALAEWKSGTRNTDPSGQMPLIAQRLSDADARAMAAYYSALPAAPPRERDVAVAWRPARATNVVSGPKASGGAQGVGSEQGSATTGASQGPGGAGGTPQGNRSGTTAPGN
ncbi:MAG TPA: c-type cytochrome [Caldimonas sp.]|nr:c-type cytochrome [Caldimonas sp.]